MILYTIAYKIDYRNYYSGGRYSMENCYIFKDGCSHVKPGVELEKLSIKLNGIKLIG